MQANTVSANLTRVVARIVVVVCVVAVVAVAAADFFGVGIYVQIHLQSPIHTS